MFSNANLLNKQDKNEPDDTSAGAFNRGNSFNPLTNAQNMERENHHLSHPQNKNLPSINEYPSKYEN